MYLRSKIAVPIILAIKKSCFYSCFFSLAKNGYGNGTFKKHTADCGHPREIRTVQLEAVLVLIADLKQVLKNLPTY